VSEILVTTSLRRAATAALTALLLAFGVNRASAGPVILEFNHVYTGATPSGAAPWLTATFEESGAGLVLLTLQGALTNPAEFFGALAFNYDGPAGLAASLPDAGEFYVFLPAAPSSLQNGGGAGTFDFGFAFETSNGRKKPRRFDGSDVITILLSAGSAITPSMFNLANDSGYFAAAHVQGIATGEGSGKIGDDTPPPPPPEEVPPNAPEPASLALMALGGLGLLGGTRLRRRLTAH
jgi:hypothetical protein